MKKEFKLGDMFDIENTWVYGKNKNWKSRYPEPTSKTVPVISGLTINNGENYYTTDTYTAEECFEDCLTISTRGEYSGTVTYHEGKFVLANNILAMPMPNWNTQCKLYLMTCINKLAYGGYQNYPTKDSLKEDKVLLPIKTDSGNNPVIDSTHQYHEQGFVPDFDYMQHRIEELERNRIEELERYLVATGLNDYELTEEDIQILSLWFQE
jgi:hypothetical protein